MREKLKPFIGAIVFWSLPFAGLAAFLFAGTASITEGKALRVAAGCVFGILSAYQPIASLRQGSAMRIASIALALAAQCFLGFLTFHLNIDGFADLHVLAFAWSLSALPLGSALYSLISGQSKLKIRPGLIALLSIHPIIAVVATLLISKGPFVLSGLAYNIAAILLSGLGVMFLAAGVASYRGFLRRAANSGRGVARKRVQSAVRWIFCVILPLACLGLNAILLSVYCDGPAIRPFGGFSWPWFLIVVAGGALISLPKPKNRGLAMARIFALGAYLPVSAFFCAACLPFIPFAPALSFIFGIGLAFIVAPLNLVFHYVELARSIKRQRVASPSHGRTGLLPCASGIPVLPLLALGWALLIRASLIPALAFIHGEGPALPDFRTRVIQNAVATDKGPFDDGALNSIGVERDIWFWGQGVINDLLIAPIATAGLRIEPQELDALQLAFLPPDRPAEKSDRLSGETHPDSRERFAIPAMGSAPLTGSDAGSIFAFNALVSSSSFHEESGLWKSDIRIEASLGDAAFRNREFVCGVETPDDALLGSHFLYIGDRKEPGRIYRRSRASAAYEKVVRRSLDPGLLRKTGYGTYELRAFPFSPGETRVTGFSVYHAGGAEIKISGRPLRLPVGPSYEAPLWRAMSASRTVAAPPGRKTELALIIDEADSMHPSSAESVSLESRAASLAPPGTSVIEISNESSGYYPLAPLKRFMSERFGKADTAILPLIVTARSFHPCDAERNLLLESRFLMPGIDGVSVLDRDGLWLLSWTGEKFPIRELKAPEPFGFSKDSSGAIVSVREGRTIPGDEAIGNPYYRIIELECSIAPDPTGGRERERLSLSRRLDVITSLTASVVFEKAADYDRLEADWKAEMGDDVESMSAPGWLAALIFMGTAFLFFAGKRRNNEKENSRPHHGPGFVRPGLLRRDGEADHPAHERPPRLDASLRLSRGQ